MSTSTVDEGGLPAAWRVPGDLPQRIVRHSEELRRADDRHYRRAVAIKAAELLSVVSIESHKRTVNSGRASGRGKAAR